MVHGQLSLHFESAISFSFPAMADDDGSSNAGIAIGVVALVLVLVLSAVVTGLCCLWCRAKKKLAYLGELLQLRVYCLYFQTASVASSMSCNRSEGKHVATHVLCVW